MEEKNQLYTYLDMETYRRRAHFDYFRQMAYPYVGMTANVDITRVVEMAKEKKTSFFLNLLHLVGNAANDMESFRQRIREDRIVQYARCMTSHTVAMPDGTYVYCAADPSLPLEQFLKTTAQKQRDAIALGELREEVEVESLIFISCIPWLAYTALTQPVPNPADSNPRITWGKHFEQNGRRMLPLTVLVNHSLMDGQQVAAFYGHLQGKIDRI